MFKAPAEKQIHESVHVPFWVSARPVCEKNKGRRIRSSRLGDPQLAGVPFFFFFFRVPKHHQAHTREQTRLLLGACALMLGVNREINYIYIYCYMWVKSFHHPQK